jgi:ankyrin repeat protein
MRVTEETRATVWRDLDERFDQGTPLRKWTDMDIKEVSQYLDATHSAWRNHPRLYIILRHLDHVDVLDTIIGQDVTDFWLPFTVSSFPRIIPDNVRKDFLSTQWVVLTQSINLERAESLTHQHFDADNAPVFESKGVLGRGAYAEVDKIWSPISHKLYARKRILRGNQFLRIRSNMTDFEKELSTIKRLRHHHIVELVGSYTDPSYVGLLFSPVAECNLKQYFQTASSTNKTALCRSFGCLATGLAYMHEHGVRHKDIKPENILVKEDSFIYTDFGISHVWDGLDHGTTQDSMPQKTPMYAAPEIFEDAPRNVSSDVWSLGCVFLEIATVLKGRQTSELHNFLAGYGKQSKVYCKNLDGVLTWLDQLKTRLEILESNAPLKWIRSTLERVPSSRPSAQQLRNSIALSSADSNDPNDYIGVCCVQTQRSTIETSHTHSQTPSSSVQSAASTLTPPSPSILDSLPTKLPLSQQWAQLNELSATDTSQSPKPGQLAKYDQTVPGKLSPRVRSPASQKLRLQSLLFSAVRKGDVPRAISLLEEGADIHSQDFKGGSPFSVAIHDNVNGIAMILLEMYPESLFFQDDDGETPLHVASMCGHNDLVEWLLEKGADHTIYNNSNNTPLHLAATNDHTTILQRLIAAGADLEARPEDGFNPLMLACRNGNDSTVRALLEAGADLYAVDENATASIHLCATHGHRSTLEILLDYGANIESMNEDLETPLMLASSSNRLSAVELLVSRGADLQARSETGRTPVLRACDSPEANLDLLKVLFNAGADLDATTNIGTGCLYFAAEKNKVDFVKYLIEQGAEPNARDEDGDTPLHGAAFLNGVEGARVLLNYGAHVDAVNKEGDTPLDIAVIEGHDEMIELLIEALE